MRGEDSMTGFNERIQRSGPAEEPKRQFLRLGKNPYVWQHIW